MSDFIVKGINIVKTVYAFFSNHFDLTWRRCWDRDTVYDGERFVSYRRVEELCLLKNIELAEKGEGAYAVEQAMTMRAFLETHPEMLPRVQELYKQGLFEMYGAGEAIIDNNMCSGETLCRNLASGMHYCINELKMTPELANHGDGFGSSAQFPQVIRKCGLTGIQDMSYSYPENRYWRGLDGSTVLYWHGVIGQSYFYDHCYHEPCRACRNESGEGCPECENTGLDLPQNFYPPFSPAPADKFVNDMCTYQIVSEEMLPAEGMNELFRAWEDEDPEVRYQWGTRRHIDSLWREMAAVDNPDESLISERVENNPVQTGCLVTRIKIKQLARKLEAEYYNWEKAVMLTAGAGERLDRDKWRKIFLEITLAYFHDAVTGTHQDVAYRELVDRISGGIADLRAEACRALGSKAFDASALDAGQSIALFQPLASDMPVRATLPAVEWREAKQLVAVDAEGKRYPLVYAYHANSPVLPPVEPWRLINAVGANARTRPEMVEPTLEVAAAAPLSWLDLKLEEAKAPQELTEMSMKNEHLEVTLGEHGVETIKDIFSGKSVAADKWTLGELLLEEDEGDPWGTRKHSAFRHGLQEFTKYMGGARFDGYQEAWYSGRFEPNFRFARERDPKIFALEWMVTVRLLDDARRVDYNFEIFWKSSDRRIRIAFPLQVKSDAGYYSIPAGWLKRDRYEMKDNFLYSPNGDWAALHGVATDAGADGLGWTVVNHGTPSARIEDGAVMMSVLRSPGFGHCLERYAQTYPMPTVGIRDGGWHHFEFQVMPFDGKSKAVESLQVAAALNQNAPCIFDGAAEIKALGLQIAGEDVELQTVKPAFDQEQTNAMVLRLVNHAAEVREAVLSLPDGAEWSAVECSMLEDAGEEIASADGKVSLVMKPFEIKTLWLERK
jgi:alpha-mannosidase